METPQFTSMNFPLTFQFMSDCPATFDDTRGYHTWGSVQDITDVVITWKMIVEQNGALRLQN